MVTLNAAIANSYTIASMAFVGRGSDYYVPDTTKLPETFDDAYVEVVYLANGSTSVPRIDNQGLTGSTGWVAFTTLWFNNRAHAGNNYYYMVGANTGTLGGNPVDGATEDRVNNFTFIFLTTYGAAKNRDIVNHESVHQFDDPADNSGHNNNRAHDNLDQSLMDDDSPRNGCRDAGGNPVAEPCGRNDLNDTHELDIDRLYQIRDFSGTI